MSMRLPWISPDFAWTQGTLLALLRESLPAIDLHPVVEQFTGFVRASGVQSEDDVFAGIQATDERRTGSATVGVTGMEKESVIRSFSNAAIGVDTRSFTWFVAGNAVGEIAGIARKVELVFEGGKRGGIEASAVPDRPTWCDYLEAT